MMSPLIKLRRVRQGGAGLHCFQHTRNANALGHRWHLPRHRPAPTIDFFPACTMILPGACAVKLPPSIVMLAPPLTARVTFWLQRC